MKIINQNKLSKIALTVLFTVAILFAQAQTSTTIFHSKYEETLVEIKSTETQFLFKQNIESTTLKPIITEDIYATEFAKRFCLVTAMFSDNDGDGSGKDYKGDLPSNLIFIGNCSDSTVIAYYLSNSASMDNSDCDDTDPRIHHASSFLGTEFNLMGSSPSICLGNNLNLIVKNRNYSNARIDFIVNGINVKSGGDTTFSTNALPVGINQIECVLTQLVYSPACIGPTTNIFTVEVGSTASPTVAIVANKTTIQNGDTVIVTATSPDGGINPNYKFFVSGTLKQGGLSNVFKSNLLHSNDSISCVITTTVACQTIKFNTSNIIIIQSDLLPITGVKEVCEGATTQLSNASLIPIGGSGFWQTGNQSVALINLLTGRVTGISEGAVLITYNVVSGGVTRSVSDSIYVGRVPVMQSTFGANAVCVGFSIQLTNNSIVPATGRSFWSSVAGRASVNASTGVVTGVSAGLATITYSIFNRGCNNIVLHYDTVRAKPAVPSIGYAAGTVNPQRGTAGAFCTNRIFTVVGSPSGGSWSTTGVLTVNAATGEVNTNATPGASNLTYTVTINGCSNSRTITGTVAACAFRGINNAQLTMQNAQWTIYPNPARSLISLNLETLIGAGSIVITDLYGKQMKAQSLSMGTNTIDVSKLAKGMYFVSVITSEGKTTKKLLVE